MTTRDLIRVFVRAALVMLLATGLSPILRAAPQNLVVYAHSGVQGTPISGYVASFGVSESNPSIADLTATIDWGDGTTNSGTIETSGFPGLYAVSGTNTYVSAGSYSLSVSVFDSSDSGNASGSNTVTIQNAPLVVTGIYFDTSANVPFDGVIATFIDENPYAAISDFTATVNWGDGSSLSSATVASQGPGTSYNVTGTHTYVAPGLKTVTVTVNDTNNQNTVAGISYTGDRIFANGFN